MLLFVLSGVVQNGVVSITPQSVCMAESKKTNIKSRLKTVVKCVAVCALLAAIRHQYVKKEKPEWVLKQFKKKILPIVEETNEFDYADYSYGLICTSRYKLPTLMMLQYKIATNRTFILDSWHRLVRRSRLSEFDCFKIIAQAYPVEVGREYNPVLFFNGFLFTQITTPLEMAIATGDVQQVRYFLDQGHGNHLIDGEQRRRAEGVKFEVSEFGSLEYRMSVICLGIRRDYPYAFAEYPQLERLAASIKPSHALLKSCCFFYKKKLPGCLVQLISEYDPDRQQETIMQAARRIRVIQKGPVINYDYEPELLRWSQEHVPGFRACCNFIKHIEDPLFDMIS